MKKCLIQIIFLLLVFTAVVCGDTGLVPFVIPSETNPNSVISFEYKPLTANDQLIARDSHFYNKNGDRVRLWGVNLSFGSNLPRKEDAAMVAKRLAAAGVNTVRMHHMDSANFPRGIWDRKTGKTFAPEALDRLDYFIDQLAKHGIYVNLNLHVGREHSSHLGLPKIDETYDKMISIFTPKLIDAQKQYAQDLLGHTNKYRKIRYSDDPAIAIVEITNENSLFMWSAPQVLPNLPDYYAQILQAKFNDWLIKKYRNEANMLKSWTADNEPLGANVLRQYDFSSTQDTSSIEKHWTLEQHSGCKAELKLDNHQGRESLFIKPVKTDNTGWHLQFNQRNLNLIKGKSYTIEFEAVATQPRNIDISVGQAHDPWQNLGFSRQCKLTEQWQNYRYSFTASDNDDNARLNFSFGNDAKEFYLTNIKLYPGVQYNLNPEESLAKKNIKVFANLESRQRLQDRLMFLAETEKEYFDDMYKFIKKDLKCKAMVTGTIVFGPLGLYAQSDMDFIDAHAYWQHPHFPGKPWDSGNWLISQKAMSDYPEQATLPKLAASRLANKPFTVTEYNHPAPLDSQAECVPMIASYGAAQDWDGLWLYTYSHTADSWDRQNLNSYFDIDSNPGKWGFMFSATAIFRDFGIERLKSTYCYDLKNLAKCAQMHHIYNSNMGKMIVQESENNNNIFTDSAIAVNLTSNAIPAKPGQTKINWQVENNNGCYFISGQKAWALSGRAEQIKTATNGKINLDAPGFCAITIVTLDNKAIEQSKKILITACGRCENQNMIFSDDRRTVGVNWGQAPVSIEPVQAKITLPNGKWKCNILKPDGTIKKQFLLQSNILELSPEYQTMWYLLQR
ncbi:MAG: carbohydrate binding domain-containing protein [Phycisphaerae bacterium]|nr:carbohydrate binding domain-containing protein [Phycisphaerae bacterium]